MTKMTCRPVVALALALTPAAAAAQAVEVGVGAALSYAQYLDTPRQCCPPLAWAAFGSGRWRLHVDYLRSHREEKGYREDPIDDVDGATARLELASLTTEPRHEANILLSWRAVERPGYSLSVLFGMTYRHSRTMHCTAFAGPVVRIPPPAGHPSDQIVFRRELTAQERSRCADDAHTRQVIWYQAAAALDVPLGERFFFRAGARLALFQADAGIGVKF